MKVLDHGEVTLVETWGSDENIIRAARQSTDGAFRGWSHKCEHCNGEGHHLVEGYMPPIQVKCDQCDGLPYKAGDERLLRFLYRNRHMTPFEMCGAIFEVKAPIFVFREWHRHRTQSYNEMSARYIPIPDENYVPDVERLLMTGGANKQAQGLKELSRFGAVGFRGHLEENYRQVQAFYENALEMGVPKELARLILPVGRYSKMWASANLRNWMQFLELRNDPAAQWEIQQYAQAVQGLLKEAFPRTIGLFEEGRDGLG